MYHIYEKNLIGADQVQILFAVLLDFVTPRQEFFQQFRMYFEIQIGKIFKQVGQIAEWLQAVGFAGFYYAINGSAGGCALR